MNSFQAWMNAKTAVATRPGATSGSRIRTKAPTRVEPRHVAALLVERDQQPLVLRPQLARQSGELLAIADVRCEEDDAAEAFGDQPPQPVGYLRSLEARQQALDHPFTAPAVSPKAIRRWTKRKKATTGIAVSVDAAIKAPQSVPREVP